MSRRPFILILIFAAGLAAACNSSSRQLLERAEARWREGNYDDAIRLNTLLYERVHTGKYAAQALLNIANIYYLNLRQIRNAIDAYKKVTDEFPEQAEDLEARKKLAEIYENEIRDLSEALTQYDKILESKELDNRAEILYRRAGIYFLQENYDRAWRELRGIEDSEPGGTHLADQVALKLGSIDQVRHQYNDAAAYFQKVTESPCRECRRQAILNLSETYEALYDFNRAIETIRKLDQFPEDKQHINREIARLTDRKRRANSGTVPIFGNPHPNP